MSEPVIESTAKRWLRRAKIILLVTLTVAALCALLLWRAWQIRDPLSAIDWPTAAGVSEPGEGVTATWLGVTTLLFDDGETQVLIDGLFTRVPVLPTLFRRVRTDVATVNYAMATYRINRLAAIVPVHSHYDHAMDIAAVANRSSAIILGSESTAMIARGGDVPVDQYQVLAHGESRQFGNFEIELLASVHAPIGLDGQEVFPGIVEAPLAQPARIGAYRTGVAWSIILRHPRGSVLVQGSGGFVPGLLDDYDVDVVFLGVGSVAALGKEHVQELWQETVVATDATRIIPIHFDDYTLPFGEVALFPRLLDDVVTASTWLSEFSAASDGATIIELPPFGEPIYLY